MSRSKRIKGLARLVRDAVEHGSLAVEKVQLERARIPFALLERVPKLAEPARAVHLVHDAAVATTHGVIRIVNRVVGDTVEAVIDEVVADEAAPPRSERDG